ncbi:BQ2448_4097 [Microbotryum intermedium]|uniref:BQ2448_4097 protein n=1 Tax=Microbotryum intermedium TaxID=269621 RepID=A0A238FFH9_9BASI|nr:BQ2448_4097 [Microbotryum intermedium]
MRFTSIGLIATALFTCSFEVIAHGTGARAAGVLRARQGQHVDPHYRARHLAARADAGDGEVLSDVPATATAIVTVSNTATAAAGKTAEAKGSIRPDDNKLPECSSNNVLGESCDPTTGSCCATGLTCLQKSCARLCGVRTVEAYCADQSECDHSLGYSCTNNRCRPPITAAHVDNGELCDQGGANTAFCIPGRGVCAGGRCQPCTLHS